MDEPKPASPGFTNLLLTDVLGELITCLERVKQATGIHSLRLSVEAGNDRIYLHGQYGTRHRTYYTDLKTLRLSRLSADVIFAAGMGPIASKIAGR